MDDKYGKGKWENDRSRQKEANKLKNTAIVHSVPQVISAHLGQSRDQHVNPLTYDLWHERYDGQQDREKLLGVYSTREEAEKALAQLRDKPGFREHPNGFEINHGAMDETG